MATKLTMAHERRKLQLRASILNGRAAVANLKDKMKVARSELSSMSGKKKSTADVSLRSIGLNSRVSR